MVEDGKRIEMPRGEGWSRVKGFHLTSLVFLDFTAGEMREQLENPEWKSAMLTPLERTLEILNTDLDVEGWEPRKRQAVQCEEGTGAGAKRKPLPPIFKEIDRFRIATVAYLNLVAQQIREQIVDVDRQAELLWPVERTVEILNQHFEVDGLRFDDEAS